MVEALWLSRLSLNPARRDTWGDVADCHAMHRRLLMAFPDLPDVTQAREHFGLLYRIEQQSGGGLVRSAAEAVAETAAGAALGQAAHGRVVVLAQSRVAPDWSQLPLGYLLAPPVVKALDPLYDALRPEMELVFRLQANPTRRIRAHNRHESEQWRGKRVQVRGVEAQLDWLRRKGASAGFAVLEARVRPSLPALTPAVTPAAAQADQRARAVARESGSASGANGGANGGRNDGTGVGATKVAGYRAATGDLTLDSALFEGRLRIIDLAAFHHALEQGIGSGKAYGFGLLSIAPVTRSAPVLR